MPQTPKKSSIKGMLVPAITLVMVLMIAGAVYVMISPYGNDKRAVTPPISRSQSGPANLAAGSMRNFLTHPQPKAVAKLPLTDGRNKATSLEAFRGKLVLLNFWATWCAPCLREMPSLDRLQARLGGDNFMVVPVNVDRGDISRARKFYKKVSIESLGLYHDAERKAMSGFAILGMPTTLLLDPQGREIGRLVGPAEWDSDEAVKLIEGELAKAAKG